MNRLSTVTSHLVPPTSTRTPTDISKLSLSELRSLYGQARPNGLVLDGANHIAWVSSDMSRTIWFWCEVLGCKLSKTIELPHGGQHFFIDAGRGLQVAYFYFGAQAQPGVKGVSVVDEEAMLTRGEFATSHGSVNHVALNVRREDLVRYRNMIKAAKFGFVSPILYHSDVDPSGYSPKRDEHTMWESFYFFGPDKEYLELTSATDRPFTPEMDIRHVPKTTGE